MISALALRMAAWSKPGAKAARRPLRGQPVRDQGLGDRRPILLGEMRIEGRGEDVELGEGLDREEDRVGEEEGLQRPKKGAAPPRDMRLAERARAGQQGPEGPRQPPVDIAELAQELADMSGTERSRGRSGSSPQLGQKAVARTRPHDGQLHLVKRGLPRPPCAR